MLQSAWGHAGSVSSPQSCTELGSLIWMPALPTVAHLILLTPTPNFSAAPLCNAFAAMQGLAGCLAKSDLMTAEEVLRRLTAEIQKKVEQCRQLRDTVAKVLLGCAPRGAPGATPPSSDSLHIVHWLKAEVETVSARVADLTSKRDALQVRRNPPPGLCMFCNVVRGKQRWHVGHMPKATTRGHPARHLTGRNVGRR